MKVTKTKKKSEAKRTNKAIIKNEGRGKKI